MTLSDLTSKTPEELNVMCAELLGWEFWSELAIGSDGKQQLWKHPEHKIVTNMDEHIKAFTYARAASQLPNYTGSWDAIMPEVRKLKGKQADTFIDFLMALTDGGTGPAFCVMFRIMSATSDQLTIALILTLTSQH